MNIPDDLFSASWQWAAWIGWSATLFLALLRAGWRDFRQGGRFNLWLGMIVLSAVIWSLRAGVKPGLEMHFVGAALFVLCFGPWLGWIGLSVVLAAVTLNGGLGWKAYALNNLLTCGVGVALSYTWLQLCERRLPRHLFVYVFAAGFFGAGIAILGVGFASVSAMAAAGIYPIDYLLDEYLPYYCLLAFSEAWLSGMLLTLFVIYRPAWVITFDDKQYLNNS